MSKSEPAEFTVIINNLEESTPITAEDVIVSGDCAYTFQVEGSDIIKMGGKIATCKTDNMK